MIGTVLISLIIFISTTNFANAGFNLTLIHRDIPLSPFHNPNATRYDLNQAKFDRSVARMRALTITPSAYKKDTLTPHLTPGPGEFSPGHTCGANQQCAYRQSYLDGSTSDGTLMLEQFAFEAPDRAIERGVKILFGCGSNNVFHSPSADRAGVVAREPATHVGELDRAGADHYSVPLESISLGATRVPGFPTGQVVTLDSGTTMTFLEPGMFVPVLDAVRGLVKGIEEMPDPRRRSELCNKATTKELIDAGMPVVELGFVGGARLE
ncbi:hypothetical protein QJS10_CPA03g00162 [Acorus calamus]|uniref:Xylanase inhibitor C-terminal domain-containing protein n=1 Tax=Acorus calamus TaxID=4465 RepID=A0AAV9FBM8_ACOCL|nr:hypothetical protein QJS10_CPA03g00162 [Acorus calamus]